MLQRKLVSEVFEKYKFDFDFNTENGIAAAWRASLGHDEIGIMLKARCVLACDEMGKKPPCATRLAAVFRDIYSGKLLPGLVTVLSNRYDLLIKIARLAPSLQEKLLKHPQVQVFELADGKPDHRLISLQDLRTDEAKMVLDDERFNDLEQQAAYFARNRKSEFKAKPIDEVVHVDRARNGLVFGVNGKDVFLSKNQILTLLMDLK